MLGQITGILDSTYIHNSTYRLMLGAYGNSTDTDETFHLEGSISEVLVFKEALNDSMQSLVEKYLRSKYTPPVNLGADIVEDYGFCGGTLDASPRFMSYLWSTGATSQTISVNTPGPYSVTTTDVFGFTSSDTILFDFQRFSIEDTTICLGDTTTWDTNLDTLYYTFLWQDGSTANKYKIYEQGEYWVEVTDTFGCTARDTAYISVDSFGS